MGKIYAKMVSHPSGNLTFQVKNISASMWTDKQLGFISRPEDNDEFMARVNADLKSYENSGIEVIWLP